MLTSHIFKRHVRRIGKATCLTRFRELSERRYERQHLQRAKQLYLEQYASAIVTGGYLKIAVTAAIARPFWAWF